MTKLKIRGLKWKMLKVRGSVLHFCLEIFWISFGYDWFLLFSIFFFFKIKTKRFKERKNKREMRLRETGCWKKKVLSFFFSFYFFLCKEKKS